MINFVKLSKIFAIAALAVIAVGAALFFTLGVDKVGNVGEYDVSGVIIALVLSLVCGFAYGLVRFRKTIGVKAAVLTAAAAAVSPLFYVAALTVSRTSLSTEPEGAIIFVSVAALIFTMVCLEVILAGKLSGTTAPFSEESVNASVMKMFKLVAIPAAVIILAAVVLGIVMLIKANTLAMLAMFTIAFAVLAIIFVPLFAIVPFASKK